MKPATLAFLAMLLLVPSTAFPRAVEGRPAAPPQGQSQNPAPAAKPAPAADAPAGSRVGERRRRVSYARCNRLSHEKNLRGGTRRRFMIRCRLGYEKPRQPSQQPSVPVQAQPPQNPSPSQTAPAAPPPAKRP